MAFASPTVLHLGGKHVQCSQVTCAQDGKRLQYFVNARAAASPGEVARIANAEAAATAAREAVEKKAVESVVVETSDAFRDGRYGTCFSCGEPIAIPGLSHVLCPECGWVSRPAETEDVPLPGHHD